MIRIEHPPAVSVVVDAGSYAHFVTQRTGNYRLVIARVIGSEFSGGLVFPGTGRVLRYVLDGPAHIGAAKQSPLRTFQHFNAFNVDRSRDLPLEQLHIIGIEADTLHHAKG